ncbi:MAG: four helix bundle protein [Bacteroidales bacterium]|nr:four helix bundle protein [Bacteroidales bacterium]
MTINTFEELEIWQLARELCKLVKKITDNPPFCNDFKFRDQIRASSGSVMDNIAEGFERDGNREFSQFLSIAKGSNGEVRSQSYRAFDYNYIKEAEFNELLERTETLGNKIGNFMKYIKTSDIKGRKFQ